jgi:hypothetical protein
MKLRKLLNVAIVSLCAAPLVGHADDLECQGTIIAQGDTVQHLLELCGEPKSRDGSDWLYEIPGSLSLVVTIGDGVVMFVRDADSGPDSASPLGDHI